MGCDLCCVTTDNMQISEERCQMQALSLFSWMLLEAEVFAFQKASGTPKERNNCKEKNT